MQILAPELRPLAPSNQLIGLLLGKWPNLLTFDGPFSDLVPQISILDRSNMDKLYWAAVNEA